MAGDNPLDDGQANAGAFELADRMEPLKDAKESYGMLRIESDAIVADEEDGLEGRFFRSDFDAGFALQAGEQHLDDHSNASS